MNTKILYLLSVGYMIIAPVSVSAENWIYPRRNLEVHIDNFEKFSKYQNASAAIWKYSDRNFLLRYISQLPEIDSDEIEISSLVGNKSNGFQRKLVKLSWEKSKGWTVKEKSSVAVSENLALKAHKIVKDILVKSCAGEEVVFMGLDSPPNMWECLQDVEKGVVLQGMQFDIPSDKGELNEYRFLRFVMFGEKIILAE